MITPPLSDLRYPEIPLGVECALPSQTPITTSASAAPAVAGLGGFLRRLFNLGRAAEVA